MGHNFPQLHPSYDFFLSSCLSYPGTVSPRNPILKGSDSMKNCNSYFHQFCNQNCIFMCWPTNKIIYLWAKSKRFPFNFRFKRTNSNAPVSVSLFQIVTKRRQKVLGNQLRKLETALRTRHKFSFWLEDFYKKYPVHVSTKLLMWFCDFIRTLLTAEIFYSRNEQKCAN